MEMGEEMPHSMGGKQELYDYIKNNGIVFEHVRLSSGVESDYYYDLRKVSHHPHGLRLIAGQLLKVIKKTDAKSVGGLATAAIPVSTAVVLEASRFGEYKNSLTAFFVRDKVKDHGLMKQIEGMVENPVAIVDDVLTSGQSIMKAINAAEAHGYTVVCVACILDREEHGVENILTQNGIRYTPLFRHSDFKSYIDSKLSPTEKK